MAGLSRFSEPPGTASSGTAKAAALLPGAPPAPRARDASCRTNAASARSLAARTAVSASSHTGAALSVLSCSLARAQMAFSAPSSSSSSRGAWLPAALRVAPAAGALGGAAAAAAPAPVAASSPPAAASAAAFAAAAA